MIVEECRVDLVGMCPVDVVRAFLDGNERDVRDEFREARRGRVVRRHAGGRGFESCRFRSRFPCAALSERDRCPNGALDECVGKASSQTMHGLDRTCRANGVGRDVVGSDWVDVGGRAVDAFVTRHLGRGGSRRAHGRARVGRRYVSTPRRVRPEWCRWRAGGRSRPVRSCCVLTPERARRRVRRRRSSRASRSRRLRERRGV